jgi:ABC-type branched-subunit amino acid transport system permease subunit
MLRFWCVHEVLLPGTPNALGQFFGATSVTPFKLRRVVQDRHMAVFGILWVAIVNLLPNELLRNLRLLRR